MDFIYCKKCRGHHDSGVHTGKTDSATENNRTVKKAWDEYTRRNPDARPREGRTPSAVPPRIDADGSSDPSPRNRKSSRRNRGKRSRRKNA